NQTDEAGTHGTEQSTHRLPWVSEAGCRSRRLTSCVEHDLRISGELHQIVVLMRLQDDHGVGSAYGFVKVCFSQDLPTVEIPILDPRVVETHVRTSGPEELGDGSRRRLALIGDIRFVCDSQQKHLG